MHIQIQRTYATEESDAGEVGAHDDARVLTKKILRLGVYWMDVYKDATKLPRKCLVCQAFTLFQINLTYHLLVLASPGLFINEV